MYNDLFLVFTEQIFKYIFDFKRNDKCKQRFYDDALIFYIRLHEKEKKNVSIFNFKGDL